MRMRDVAKTVALDQGRHDPGTKAPRREALSG